MKIFKLFVSIALILSISLINSFAAISVSDGSAFVTKAEFAADLNNLSNRMSTLENSLDAKIDSLVSSYLSRNGIWSGEDQLNFTSAEKTTGYRVIVSNTNAQKNALRDALKLGGSSQALDIANGTLITSCSKSGLLISSFKVLDSSKSTVQTYHEDSTVPRIDGTAYHFDWILNGSLSLYFSVLIGSSNEASRFLIASSNGNYVLAGSTYYLTRFLFFFPMLSNTSFFVSKGDKINYKLFVAYNFQQAMPPANTDPSGVKTGSISGNSQGTKIAVLESGVY